MIAIINYGVGNIKSIQNMLKKIGANSIITNNQDEISAASHIILPGVGAFDYGMQQLQKSELMPLLDEKILTQKTPTLGICLGAQMLGNKSEEGNEKGLGWIDMDIVKFKFEDHNLKVPHMNWSEIIQQKESVLFNGMFDVPRFYFVHSYYMKPHEKEDALCTANYGGEFTAAVEKDNIYGVQFHPEKSHKFGMKLLENFAKI